MDKRTDLKQLKTLLSSQLLDDQVLQRPQGVSTGIQQLDEFLFWKGFPRNGLSLIQGPIGLGATSFWIRAAQSITLAQGWTAWINIKDSSQCILNPGPLFQQQVDLSRLLVVDVPSDSKKVFFALQELLSCELFELVGCDLTAVKLPRYQVERLQRLSRKHKTAAVFINNKRSFLSPQLFSLMIQLQPKKITVSRALYRPTPYSIRRIEYANFMSQLTQGMQGISSRGFSQVQPLRTVS